jgi:transposase
MKKKKIYTSEEKTMILREHLENKVSIGDLSEKFGLHPNAIYKWKKKMYESAPDTLARPKKVTDRQLTEAQRRIKELETILSVREELIAELAADNINLKKKLNGESSLRNGLSRTSGMK